MLSLPLHIICIQSPYDMYPSMIVRENSHVKRARSQQHTDIDPYQLLWSISTLIATRSPMIYMHGMHPTNWCLHKRVCILFSILHMSHSSVCMVYHSIPVSTRIQHDPRSSYTSVTCLWAHVWWYWRSFELRSAFVHMMCTFTRFEYIDVSQDVYNQDNTRTYIISSDIGMYYALSKHSYVPVTSRLQVSFK